MELISSSEWWYQRSLTERAISNKTLIYLNSILSFNSERQFPLFSTAFFKGVIFVQLHAVLIAYSNINAKLNYENFSSYHKDSNGNCVPKAMCDGSIKCGKNALCVMRPSKSEPNKFTPKCVCKDGYFVSGQLFLLILNSELFA